MIDQTLTRDLASLFELKRQIFLRCLGAQLQFRFPSSLCPNQHLNLHRAYCQLCTSLVLLYPSFISLCRSFCAAPLSLCSWSRYALLQPCGFSFPSSFYPLGATLLTRKPIPTLSPTNIHLMTCNRLGSRYRLALSRDPSRA